MLHLYSDSSTAVAIFQTGKRRDSFIHACAKEVWVAWTEFYITLGVAHTLGEALMETADALSCWHMGQHYKDHINTLEKDRG